MPEQVKRIIIQGNKKGLPYSKGLMSTSIMAAGIDPSISYQVAEMIEDKLREQNTFSITIGELNDIVYDIIKSELGIEKAQNYLRWQTLGELEKPLIVLVGGTTGVGKSTLAAEVAHRLGIRRISSTDSIREVMRAIFSRELMPYLYESSFNAFQMMRVPLPERLEPMIIGFREQIATVNVGITAIIERAIAEGVNMIIEGIHIVPGFLSLSKEQLEKAFIIPLIIKVEDEYLHKSHFYGRELETGGFRPFKKYLDNFDNIRRIGKYIEELACENGTPVIDSRNLDHTVETIINHIIDSVFSQPEVSEKMKVLFKKD